MKRIILCILIGCIGCNNIQQERFKINQNRLNKRIILLKSEISLLEKQNKETEIFNLEMERQRIILSGMISATEIQQK